MQALVFDEKLELKDVPRPEIHIDEALLKIRLAGICNTDLELIKGYMSFSGVLGHEFIAEVVDGPDDLIGKRVVGEINVACGKCNYCERGISSHCPNRTTVGIDRHDGAFAEYMRLVTKNLHVVPDNITDIQAVFTEPLAAAYEILEQVDITSSDRIVLIGAGKLGLLCAQVLKQTGADLSVIVRSNKPAKLLKKWGIRAVRRDELENDSATIVVDCTGNAEGFSDALDLIQPRGTIVLKSTYSGIPQADLTRIAVDEITLVGSRCGPFATALSYLAQGVIDVDSMVDATYPLKSATEAIEHASQRGVIKVLLQP